MGRGRESSLYYTPYNARLYSQAKVATCMCHQIASKQNSSTCCSSRYDLMGMLCKSSWFHLENILFNKANLFGEQRRNPGFVVVGAKPCTRPLLVCCHMLWIVDSFLPGAEPMSAPLYRKWCKNAATILTSMPMVPKFLSRTNMSGG